MPFARCYYHIVWTTKYRVPVIEPVVEAVIFGAIKRKSAELRCKLFAVNGTTDHVHVAVGLPPAMSPAKYIGAVKGLSSHCANHDLELAEPFQWQGGYGVLTFGEKVRPYVCAYIANQKSHHVQGTVQPYLEETEDQ